MARVGISLGSNLGDRIVHLRSAIERLSPVRLSEHLLLSPVFETEPIDCPEGSGAFYNAVIEIETEESGKSLPRRLFKRFFSRGGSSVEAEVIEALPAESSNRRSSSAPQA